MGLNPLALIAIVLLALVGMVALLNSYYPGTLADQDSQIRVVHSLVLLSVIGSSLLLTLRNQSLGTSIRHALIWIALGLILVVGYSYRDVFEDMSARVGAEIDPTTPANMEAGVVKIVAANDGHFHTAAEINGRRVRLLVDTGATSVALTADDAIRAGYDLTTLVFNQPISTANGTNFAARIRLDTVQIGNIKMHDVTGMVTKEGLNQSLLGMSFLSRLQSIETQGDRLILRE